MCTYLMRYQMSLQRHLPELALLALTLGVILRILGTLSASLMGSALLALLMMLGYGHRYARRLYSVTLMLAASIATVLEFVHATNHVIKYAILVAGASIFAYSATRFSTLFHDLAPISATIACLAIICIARCRAVELAPMIIVLTLIYLLRTGRVRKVFTATSLGGSLIVAYILALCLVTGLELQNVESTVAASMSLGYSMKLLLAQNTISRSP